MTRHANHLTSGSGSSWRMRVWVFLLVCLATLGPIATSHAQLLYTISSTTPVNLVFDDISDFRNGVTTGTSTTITIRSLLTLISNKDVVVGTASNLTQGAVSIPASIVRVTSMSQDWTNHSNFLNTSTQQTVTSGISLGVLAGNRTYPIRYDVPPTPALLNRADGIYTTQLTYAFSGLLGNTASVTLNLQIQNVLGITAVGNPTFTIDEESEFANGATVNQNGALVVFATRDYDVNVQASGPFSSGTRTIPINRLRIGVSNAGGTITQPVQMVATGVQIVNEAPATLQQSLNLQYILQGGAHLLNLPNGSYSTTLTYTISAD